MEYFGFYFNCGAIILFENLPPQVIQTIPCYPQVCFHGICLTLWDVEDKFLSQSIMQNLPSLFLALPF